MTRDEFRQQMNNFKKARENNPQLSYWEWKANKYKNGTDYVNDTNLPEIVVTPDRNYVNQPFDQDAYNSAMLDAWGKQIRIGPEDVVDYLPIIGDIKGIYDIANDFANGQYLAGGIGLGLTLLPNFIEKPLRRTIRKYKRNRNFVKQIREDLSNMSYLPLSVTQDYVLNKTQPTRELYNKIFKQSYRLRNRNEIKKYNSTLLQRYKEAQDQATKLNEVMIQRQLPFLKNFYKYSDDQIQRITNIFKEDPNYTDFIYHNVDLNPLTQEAVDKYLQKQTTSVRGVSFSPDVVSEKDIDSRVKQALTVNSENHYGGDRLDTNRTGIYTSNSGEIADRFSRPIGNVDDVRKSRADIALLSYPYQNDKNLTIEQQLRNFRRSIYPYDLFGSPDYRILARNGFIAKEAQYTTRNGSLLPGYERAYFAEQPNQQLLNTIDQNTFYTDVDKRGRWGFGGVQSVPELEKKLFEGYRPGNSFGDFVRFARFSDSQYMDIGDIYKSQLPMSQADEMHANALLNNLYEKQHKLSNIYRKIYDSQLDTRLSRVDMRPIGVGTALLSVPLVIHKTIENSVDEQIDDLGINKDLKDKKIDIDQLNLRDKQSLISFYNTKLYQKTLNNIQKKYNYK